MCDQVEKDAILMENGHVNQNNVCSQDEGEDGLNEFLLPKRHSTVKQETAAYRIDYEFTATTMNLCKAILGATIMALPRAVMELGVIFGIIVFTLVGIFTYFSLYAILRGNNQTGQTTYSGVLQNLVGRFSAVALDVAQILDIIGILILYLMIIGDILVGRNCEGLLYDLSGINQPQWYFSRSFVLGVICVFFICPWLFFDRLDKLAPASVLGTCMIICYTLCLVGMSVGAGVRGMSHTPPMWPKKVTGGEGMLEIASLVPIFVMALICHQNILPIMQNLRAPSFTVGGLRRRAFITSTSIGLTTLLILVSSICALIVFGENIKDDVMSNITVEELTPLTGRVGAMVVTSIIRVGFVVNLTGSFLVNALPLRSILISYLMRQNKNQNQNLHQIQNQNQTQTPKWLFFLLTFVILGSSYILAVEVHSIWQVVKLIGAVCANALAFIFPPLIMIALTRINVKFSFFKLVFPGFLIVLGIVSGISGLYTSFVHAN